MKRIKLIAMILFLFLLMISTSCVKATSSDYEITGYDVNIVVSEEKVLKITETITVNFLSERYGIEKIIPLGYKVYNSDGTFKFYTAEVSNVRVNERYSTSIDYDPYKYKKIKIGDENTLLTGEKTYTISYTYKIRNEDDKFYFNIIDYNWDTTVENITFTITMPKEFDKDNIRFYYGGAGYSSSRNVEYSVDGTAITGSIDSNLWTECAFTIKLELDDGYFNISPNGIFKNIFYITIYILFVIIALKIYQKKCKKTSVVKKVETYPPDDLNNLEVGFLYNEYVDYTSIAALLVYLANKGYIKVEKCNEKNYFSSDNFKITKLKEYDGNKDEERVLMEEVFYKGNEVETKELRKYFYKIQSKIANSINTKQNETIIHTEDSIKARKTIGIFFLVEWIIFGIHSIMISTYSMISIGITILMWLISFSLVRPFLISHDKEMKWAVGLIFTPFIAMIILSIFNIFDFAMDFTLLNISSYLVGIISLIILIELHSEALTRTEKSEKLYTKILGFKDFLEKAKKDELENILIDHPNYFYDIFPYIYAFGLQLKWIKKFKGIEIIKPEWGLNLMPEDVNGMIFIINTPKYSKNDYDKELVMEEHSEADKSNSKNENK